MTSIAATTPPEWHSVPASPRRIKPTGRVLAQILASELGVTWEDLRGPRRQRDIVQARQIAQWIILKQTDLSLPQIGRLFNRDHTTILHTRRTMHDKIANDDGLAARIEDLYTAALTRWREDPGNPPPVEIEFTSKAKPAHRPTAVTPTPKRPYDEVSKENNAVRFASRRLLELLREHHPDKEVKKDQ